MVDRRELGAIFLGGAIGTLTRAGLVEAFGKGASGWPWATFSVNVVGAFLLGYLVAALPPVTRGRPLLTTGFCGALTTFSTMQVEMLSMLEAGRGALSIGYGLGSVVAGLIGVQLGTAAGRKPRLG
jgi:fluoride exporter